MKRILLSSIALLYFGVCGCSNSNKNACADYNYQPPWQKPSLDGINFTVSGIDNVPDIYGDVSDPQLVVFMGGNQFMVVDDLVKKFKQKNPQVKRVLIETLPPGILQEQLKTGRLIIGKMRLSIKPDIFMAGTSRINEMQNANHFFSTFKEYTTNKLSIMVKQNNPLGIKNLIDLGRDDVNVAMPNAKWEGIADLIRKAYQKAGGEELAQKILNEKVKNNTTRITKIHHRQTPLWILNNLSDAGVVWQTEVLFQKSLGHPIEGIEIPAENNVSTKSSIGLFKDAPHPTNARAFYDFLTSPEAREVYQKYGFGSVAKRNIQLVE